MAEHDPPFRSRKVLDYARGQPCTLRFSVCNRNPETTVACHIRDRHKGMGVKASDASIAFGCSACHVYLDEGRWIGQISEADMLKVVLRGLQETTEILIRDQVIGFPHDRITRLGDKPVKPRAPKEQRAKVPSGRPLQSRTNWPKGRKIPSRNDIRRSD